MTSKDIVPFGLMDGGELSSYINDPESYDGAVDPRDMSTLYVPIGTTSNFAFRTADGEEESRKSLTGVVVNVYRHRAYYASEYSENNKSAPDCASIDKVQGIGDNGTGLGVHQCEGCPRTKWTTKLDDDGNPVLKKDGRKDQNPPDCSENIELFTLTEEEALPVRVHVAPGSLATVNPYLKSFKNQLELTEAGQRVPRRIQNVLTEFTIDRSDGKSRIRPRRAGELQGEQRDLVASYKEALTPFLQEARLAQRTARQAIVDEAYDKVDEEAEQES